MGVSCLVPFSLILLSRYLFALHSSCQDTGQGLNNRRGALGVGVKEGFLEKKWSRRMSSCRR